jgi:hypothetical protein
MIIYRFEYCRKCNLLRNNESELKDFMRKFVFLFASLNLKLDVCIFAKNGEIFHQKVRLPSNFLVLFTTISVTGSAGTFHATYYRK